MKLHPNELLFYYHPECSKCKKTRAYAYSITSHVNEFILERDKFTTTWWRDVLDMLNLKPKDLLDKSHPDYQEKIARHNYDDEGWLNILTKYPYLIKAPIAIRKNKAILCTSPKDIYKVL